MVVLLALIPEDEDFNVPHLLNNKSTGCKEYGDPIEISEPRRDEDFSVRRLLTWILKIQKFELIFLLLLRSH
jgi:hypothetical protein